MIAPLRVGDVLPGYCGGTFGRDAYAEKRVEAIGSDWVVVRDETGTVYFGEGCPEDLVQYRDDRDAR